MKYKPGQRVHVEYDGVIDNDPAGGRVVVRDSIGDRHFYIPDDVVTITPAEPANWPPQVGDVWEADGQDWYVRRYYGTSGTYVIESFDGRNHGNYFTDSPYGGSVDEFKERNPVLTRRRGEPEHV